MKILHYVDENRLSWAVPWLQLLEAQRDLGDENWVVCRPGGTLWEMVKTAGFDVLSYKPLFPSLPPLCLGFPEILEKVRPDLIHTRLSAAAAIGGYWGKKNGIPVISTVDKFSKVRYYRDASRLFACSGAVKRHISQGGFPSSKIEVVHNAIDSERYRPNSAIREEMRRKMGLEDRNKVILGAGRLVDWKGFDVLIRAFSLLRDSNSLLWILGDGPEKEPLQRLIEKHGLESVVSMFSFVRDLRPYLWASDLFVLPSRTPEPFGFVLLEAMASGLPVIATAAGGPLDIIEDGKSGWLVAGGDENALAGCMRETLQNLSLMRRLCEGAITRARRFDVLKCAEKTRCQYRYVIEENGAER